MTSPRSDTAPDADGTSSAVPHARDAVVVGGGVAGLVAARELARAGLRTVVLEGRDAPGGAVRGHTVAGLRLDAGAESFATRGGTVAAYLADLGLADRVCGPAGHGSWVHLPSGDGPLPRTGLLGIPADPWAPDVRRTIGLVGALRASLDLVLPARVGSGATTLGALVRARLGSRVLDRLVRPVVGGVHAADPDDLAVGAVSPGLPAALRDAKGSLARAVRSLRAAAPAGSAVQGVDGGLHLLVDALVADVEAHGGEVRTRTRVTEVRPAGDDPTGYEVVLADGAVLRASRLVLATPTTGDLLRPLLAATSAASDGPDDVPGTPADPTDGLDEGAVVTLVTLVLRSTALDAAPRGTGVLVAQEATDVTAKALTHGTAKWPWLARAAGPGRHVVRLSYGRAGDDASAVPADKDALVDLALRDAAVLLGVPLPADAVEGTAVVRWTQALPRPSAAHQAAVTEVRSAAAALPGVAVCGAWAAGNGLASVVPDAQAAARTLL